LNVIVTATGIVSIDEDFLTITATVSIRVRIVRIEAHGKLCGIRYEVGIAIDGSVSTDAAGPGLSSECAPLVGVHPDREAKGIHGASDSTVPMPLSACFTDLEGEPCAGIGIREEIEGITGAKEGTSLALSSEHQEAIIEGESSLATTDENIVDHTRIEGVASNLPARDEECAVTPAVGVIGNRAV